MDENKPSKLSLVWTNFLEIFFEDQSNFSFHQNENRYIEYLIKNVFDTSIDLSSKYGFMSIIFSDEQAKKEFLVFIKIAHEKIEIVDGVEQRRIFPKEEFPSRIYQANKLTLSFYDDSNKLPNNVKFDNRVIVFQNIITALQNFKISRIKNQFIDSLNH